MVTLSKRKLRPEKELLNFPGVGLKTKSNTIRYDPSLVTRKLISWIRLKRGLKLRDEKEPTEKYDDREKYYHRERDKEKEGDYIPKIHLDDGADAWYNYGNITRDGGTQKFYITNNGLRTSTFVVVETYEVLSNLYSIPLGDPYSATLNNRGFIDNLHPGETKTIELEWTPDTSKTYTHFNVAAYDPILDPKMPLNYHPSLFPKWHIKHNGHVAFRT